MDNMNMNTRDEFGQITQKVLGKLEIVWKKVKTKSHTPSRGMETITI